MIPKFRAWVKPGVLSNHPDGVVADAKPDFLGMECLVKRDDLKGKKCFTEIFDFEDIELMQSTGLKDKNGVEIFEGDVGWDDHLEVNGKVIYDEGKFIYEWENICDDLCEVNADIDVIGNIYENPELLEAIE
ncbi:YopX family protein [Enterococcus gilvus]|jgi:hypothetical protein|uniref:YopX protein domain-containing protein n=1 Tax=Enterococcus gilvus ATCC BAA-350 TaxID=1158614 RepID=R2XIT2_9ENTE|nr:YopX family protein [Enterococcus gilvus]EOI54814.1 hypothetical protein UKC_02851 [Enterococcus gilvus ATCC BAA-350]EOW81810.1 hypothetical protein I592_01110 [Enterococcus gilvus ATCC BAA-350]